jgi:hypothetical protein
VTAKDGVETPTARTRHAFTLSDDQIVPIAVSATHTANRVTNVTLKVCPAVSQGTCTADRLAFIKRA